MSNRSPKLFIDDIKKAISKVELYIKGLTFAEFEKDSKTVDAVIRNLEIIGEAVKNLSSEIIEKYPSVDWSGATTMRDRLIHGYFGVDVSIVWETINSDLPKLRKQVEKIWQDFD
ncbi:MAG: DUF86 domain-containing protein [Candidatus Hodarchaeota archaeon]